MSSRPVPSSSSTIKSLLTIVEVALASLFLISGTARGDSGHKQVPALGDVLRINCVQGVLQIEWADELLSDLAPLTVAGPEANWKISAVKPGPASMGQPGIGLDRLVGGGHASRHFWKVSITASPGQTRISAMRSGRTPQDVHLALHQMADGSLRVVVVERQTTAVSTRAANLLELRLRHPQVVNDCILPLLEQLGAADVLAPGAADVYRVFTEIAAEEDVADAVRALLPELSAAGFEQRQEASDALRRLGPDAVPVLLRLDPLDLTPEAQARVHKLLLEHSRRQVADSQAMRRDLRFLADCLDFNDERVRAAAMAQITQLTGWTVPPADWARPGDYVRGRILKSGK
jgi:hypothetical protein